MKCKQAIKILNRVKRQKIKVNDEETHLALNTAIIVLTVKAIEMGEICKQCDDTGFVMDPLIEQPRPCPMCKKGDNQ